MTGLSRQPRATTEGNHPLCYNPALMTALCPQPAPIAFPSRRAALDFLTTHSGLIICALFFLTGLFLAADYGVIGDVFRHREVALINLQYILGQGDLSGIPDSFLHWYYGVSFELPLLILEQVLGLEDFYYVHLLRAILTHLLFIGGGYCCYRLACRLFGSRLIALFALLLFLLHPRIYAHSYFNAADLSLVSLFAIALYLTERAFRRDTVGAFVLLGIVVGLAADLRIMGLMLLPAVAGMRVLDLARGVSSRKHILLTGGVFALATLLTDYALSPYAWTSPVDALTGSLSLHNNLIGPSVLFQGTAYPSADPPPHYGLTWFVITTPPAIMLLGFIGIAAVLGKSIAQPAAIFRNSRLRFSLLLLACFILPLLAIAPLDADIYDGWRLLYFCYVPFSLLAAGGLHWVAGALSGWHWRRAGAYGLAGLGLGLTLLQMAQLHPAQHLYFNSLVNRVDSDYLKSQYNTDYWSLALTEGLEHILERHPGQPLALWVKLRLAANLTPAQRQPLTIGITGQDPDYHLVDAWAEPPRDTAFNSIYENPIYNNRLIAVKPLDAARMEPAAAASYTELYRQATAREPLIRAEYDIFLNGRTLTFIKENCQPGDRAIPFTVTVFWNDRERPPGRLSDLGRKARFSNSGVRLGQRCLAVIQLPDQPIAHIIAGQYADPNDEPTIHKWLNPQGHIIFILPSDFGRRIWAAAHSFTGPGLTEMTAALRESGPQPFADTAFTLFREKGRLIYHRQPCQWADTQRQFFLHIIPERVSDLPPQRRQYGFDNRGFSFYWQRGLFFDNQCLASVPLPDYPIAQIRTGQEGIWEFTGHFPITDRALREAAAAIAVRPPYIQSVFDLYLWNRQLIYRRQPCAASDTTAQFFLHLIPQDTDHLPEEQRPYGFANRDFLFDRRGGRLDRMCLAIVPLPDYPIASIRTGQYAPGQGQLWAAELALDEREGQ